jgi:hypothetical protein
LYEKKDKESIESDDLYAEIIFDYLKEYYGKLLDEISNSSYEPYVEALIKNKKHIEELVDYYISNLKQNYNFEKRETNFSTGRKDKNDEYTEKL